ncbi:MAG: hypothetical protein WDM92_06480 [Caulobacteraceae bacterium]
MDAVQALWRDAPTPAARLTFRRAWVAGMLYRAMLERSTKGAGIGGSGEGEPDGGLLSRLGAKGMAMVKVTEADKLLARIHKAFGPDGARSEGTGGATARRRMRPVDLGDGGWRRRTWPLWAHGHAGACSARWTPWLCC